MVLLLHQLLSALLRISLVDLPSRLLLLRTLARRRTLMLLQLLRVLYLDSKGHLGVIASALRHILIVSGSVLLVLLHLGQGGLEVYRLLLLGGRHLAVDLLLWVVLEVLHVLAMLGRLLDHIVQLLLGHADYGQLAHLRVPDHSRLLQELLLQSGEKLVLAACICSAITIVEIDEHGHESCGLLQLLLLHVLLMRLVILDWGPPVTLYSSALTVV